ncbi:MAG TPA: hypothetical protein VM470_05220 [Acidimicrobiia bacterium]|nr:hypothetical protein [Acidimicrobiia bacterium]
MKSKKVLLAAVGAPVVAARKVGERVEEIRAAFNKEADSLSQTAGKRVDVWAEEGEKVVTRISDGKVVDELAAKVDFDQVQEQVSKLRDQLEDMLATWRASFRPEKVAAKASVTGEPSTAPKSTARKTTARKSTARKSTVRKSTGPKKTVAAKSTASKKAATAKAPAAKKTTAAKNTTAAKKTTDAKKAPAAKAS